jgi:hypothetical protein
MILGIVVLMGWQLVPETCSTALSQESSHDTNAALKECDRLWDQVQKFRAAGKTAEAIAAAESMLRIKRKVLRAGPDELAVPLDWLAGLYLEREDFAAARAARKEALEILRQRYGATHWKVTDARLALEDVERWAGMTGEER